MPFEIRARNGGKLVLIRHSGDVDSKEVTDAIREIDHVKDPDDPPRLLVDVRAAKSFPHHEELLTYLWQHARNAPPIRRLALVTSEQHRETIEVIVSGHESLGTPARIFEDELEALTWVMRSRQEEANRKTIAAFDQMSSVRVYVSDLDRARVFYADTLGLSALEHAARDGQSMFRLSNVGLLLETVDPDDDDFEQLVGRQTGITLRVKDIDGVYVRLSSLGVQFVDEPHRRETGDRVVSFRDVDDNVLTLIS